MAQRNTRLLPKELRIVIGYGKILHPGKIARHRRRVYPLRIRLLDLDETGRKRVSVIDVHNRFKVAHADAAGDADIHLGRCVRADCVKRGVNPARACGDSAATLAYDNPHDATPSALILRTISRADSGVSEPYAVSLIIITGESEQQPRHATSLSENNPSSVVPPSSMPSSS